MKYTTIFSSTVRPLVPEERDKYLAMASLVDVGEFIPDIDTEANIDILPIAFNACVVNRVNKNGDVIDSSVATEVVDNFINKPINIEHNREQVVGTILTAGFSEFGTDRSLSEEQAKEMTGPYNITLGGIVWKIVNSSLADMIESSNDPTDENYQKISASWELGFSGYNLVALEGTDKNIENGRVIEDPSEIEEFSKNLKSFGGSGKIDDNTYVYRKVFEDVLPLGIGLTETPAADVVGVAVKKDEATNRVQADEQNFEKAENLEITSLSEDNNVKLHKVVAMKITSLKDISDESLKTLEASTVHEFIQEELRKASEDYSAKQKEGSEALEAKEEQNKVLSEEQEALKVELNTVSENLKKLEAENKERQAQECFNERMASLDETYELTDEHRKVIANEIKELDDENFEKYSEKMKVFLPLKPEEVAEATETEEVVTKEAVASEEEEPQKEEVVDEAIDNANVEEDAIANTTEAQEATVYEKYKNAFSIDGFDIK